MRITRKCDSKNHYSAENDEKSYPLYHITKVCYNKRVYLNKEDSICHVLIAVDITL